ncbi:hypothetical protein BROUX41_000182 [Berkeleyomyces rouxiae]|uniref:uncharacterized protein n=1 Tax=Berkeleyomyces rouxiae TaxID=2035830 RepID=UPI003B7FA439
MADRFHHPQVPPPQPPIQAMNDMDVAGFNLHEKRTKDGQVAKRRGPKPDSKPALTRRQQLNRQAQRTHRERKEQYIRDLENEVLKLRATLIENTKEKDQVMSVNKMLRKVLLENGIPLPPQVSNSLAQLDSGPINDASSSVSPQSNSNTHASAQNFTIPPQQGIPYQTNDMYQAGMSSAPSIPKPVFDQEQAGIEFVLTLERPCMGHLPFLLERTHDSPEPMACGHGRMLSCPPLPYSQLSSDTPWSSRFVPNPEPRSDAEGQVNQMTWDASKSGLARLLELSSQFDLDGEITPVQAWSLITGDERFGQLGREDLVKLAASLGDKVHCFGFGAVVEDFEVRDAFESILVQSQMMVRAA